MKKTGLLFILSAVTLFSCSEKTVELTPVDILTGGREKTWKVAEYFYSGQDAVQNQECFSDDTAKFSKGGDTTKFNGSSYYTYQKNAHKCGLVDDDFTLSFHLSTDKKSIFFDVDDRWDIIKFETDDFIIQTPDQLRKLRFTPKDTTGA